MRHGKTPLQYHPEAQIQMRGMTLFSRYSVGIAFLCLYCCVWASGAEADAGLALSHFQNAKSILKERNTWAKVIQRLEIGDMPPADASPMAKEDRQKLIDWIRSTIHDIECGLTPNPGSVTLRRLNRFEYQNTLRDLLGMTYKPAEGFPGDDVGYGFDNIIGDVLTLPPLLMEKYFSAAEEISQLAIQTPTPGPVFESRIKLEDLQADRGGSSKDGKFAFVSDGKISFDETLPWKGMFRLEAGLAGEEVAGEGPKVRVSLDGKKLKEQEVKTKSDSEAETISFPFRNSSLKKTTLSIEFINDFYALVSKIFEGQVSICSLGKPLLEVLAANGDISLVAANLNLFSLSNRITVRVDAQHHRCLAPAMANRLDLVQVVSPGHQVLASFE